MSDPNQTNPESKAPGELRSNLQIVLRIALALLLVALLGGLVWAVLRRFG